MIREKGKRQTRAKRKRFSSSFFFILVVSCFIIIEGNNKLFEFFILMYCAISVCVCVRIQLTSNSLGLGKKISLCKMNKRFGDSQSAL
jgi:hypothetical protein